MLLLNCASVVLDILMCNKTYEYAAAKKSYTNYLLQVHLVSKRVSIMFKSVEIGGKG